MVTAHKRKPLKQRADIEPKTTASAGNYIGRPKALAAATEAVQYHNWVSLSRSATIGQDREASGATRQRRCQPTRSSRCQLTMSSRVPARERTVVLRYKRTKPGGGGRKDPKRASHNRQMGHSKSFWEDDETERGRDVTH